MRRFELPLSSGGGSAVYAMRRGGYVCVYVAWACCLGTFVLPPRRHLALETTATPAAPESRAKYLQGVNFYKTPRMITCSSPRTSHAEEQASNM